MTEFRLNWDKALEAIVWLAHRQPDIDFFHISKVLYYADKAHILRYGRPVTGDVYIAMAHGPVPSGVYDLLKIDPFLPDELLRKLDDAMEIDTPHVRARRVANEDVLSGSDIEVLEQAWGQYASLPFGELSKLSHQERAYVEASPNGAMDIELLVDEDDPDKDDLMKEIREKAAYGVL